MPPAQQGWYGISNPLPKYLCQKRDAHETRRRWQDEDKTTKTTKAAILVTAQSRGCTIAARLIGGAMMSSWGLDTRSIISGSEKKRPCWAGGVAN
ncbi:hypothetical protein IF2G_04322 [Cordyceps javanica]|nr:hypothetical protein IF2G_04322 [Cordyceps javanica]